MLDWMKVISDVVLAQKWEILLCSSSSTIVHRFLVMSDRLALFRRAFNRPAADAPMDPVERPKRNSKRAIARWRQVLDKVFCLQQLIGLEESVNSWLPQALGDPKHSQLSSKQLEEYVATAESMKPLQGKIAAIKTAAECQHPAERLTMGGNQYGSWVICWDCHSRWKAPPYYVRETKKAKAKSAAMPASSAEEFKSQQAKEQIAKEIRVEFEEKFQAHAKRLREDVQQTRLEAQKNVGVLQSELREAAKMAVLNDIMMSEYAEMSVGKTRYEEHKAYYDGEMFGMAERKLAFREEMQALTELQKVCQEIPSQMTEGPMPDLASTPGAASTASRVRKDRLKSHSPVVTRRLKGEGAKERMRALEESAYYEIAELYIEGVEGGLFAVNYAEELEDGEHYVVKMRPTMKTLVEDEISEVEETALPKKTKTRLRRVEGQVRRVEGLQGERRVEGEQGGAFAVDVAEVYSPPRIASAAEKAGLNAGGSYDIQTGYDLATSQGLEAMWNGLVEDDPELAVLCPPCTPFSVLQSLNYDRMPLVKALGLLGEGLHHLGVAAEVALWQYYRGKVFLFEHLVGSKAWSEESMEHIMQLPGVFVCRTDMCRYGMRVRDGLNLKPTRWVTNSWEIAKELQRRCNGGHQHETLMGGKAAAAAVYPPQLCQAVVRGLRRHLRAQGKLSEVKLEESHVIEVMAVRRQPDDEEGDDDLDVFEDILPEEVEQYRAQRREDRRERERQRIEASVTAEDKAKVRKMHDNLGHPSKESFVRFLRAGRVREEVIQWVLKEFSCPTCAAKVIPKAPRPAVVPKCYRPGVALGLDLFYIPDVLNQRSLPVMNVVDPGTNYQMIELLENKDPNTIWSAFWATWCRTFGIPDYLSIDEGREFKGDFTRWCASFGCIVFRAAARAPWQQGRVERHGGLIKTMIETARETAVPSTLEELKLLLRECECAKNRYSNRSGYSPVQRQIGQWPRLPGSLMTDEALDPALQLQNGTEEFERLLEMRDIAHKAFLKLSCKEAAQKALKARPRMQRVFKSGEVVYVYRVLRRKKSVHGHEGPAPRGSGVGQKATWVGPGHVLAMEGSVVWINMFGELWRASIEQTREATTEERLGVEVVAEDFSEMQERLRRGSHRAGYRDVSKEVPKEVADAPEEAGDEVQLEGEERGRPRARLSSEAGAGSDEEYTPTLGPQEVEAEEGGNDEEEGFGRRVSHSTVAEPESEIVEHNVASEANILDEDAERVAMEDSEASALQNDVLDGIRPSYEALRARTQARWLRRHETPYFAEFFFQGEEEGESQEEVEERKQDYWVFDPIENVLQRHHVHWRRALFNPAGVEGSPVPLRALKKQRRTCRMADGELEEIQDEWSLFTKKEERFGWWKGVTEFKVDAYYKQQGQQLSVAAKKKRGEGEVFSHEIPEDEWPDWVAQDTAEFQKIVDSGGLKTLSLEESRRVKEELRKAGKQDRVLPSRMVRRYKPGDGPGQPRTKKSRFCIRGDRDPDAAYLSRFAPTVTTSNLQVLIQAAVNKGYKGVVGDLKAAFTQSMPLVRAQGAIYSKSCDGSMPGLHPEQIAEIKLGCYGLCDAPMHWRKTLIQYLKEELGYRQSSLDPCTFLLHGPQGLHGMVAVEVDDLLMFGDQRHEEKMKKLQSRFVFGKIEPIGEEGVNFNGRRLRQRGDTILIDMKAFVEERMELVEISKQRMKEKEQRLTEEETGLVRKACGSLNWAGREGRPDAAAAASMFSSQLMEMTIQDVIELNKVLTRIKGSSELALKIQALDEQRMRWGVISDASWANARGGKTQGGHLLIAFDCGMLEGKTARCNLLHWKSGKLQRTVGSTLAAETQSLARGIGDLLWMMVMYWEMVDPDFQLREWRKHVKKLGYSAFTKHQDTEELSGALAVVDAKSLYDVLAYETTGGADRRTALDVQVLREELADLGGVIRWVDHMHMPADVLTKKQGRCEVLNQMLETGHFGITAEAVTLDSRLAERQVGGYNKR